MRNDNVTKIIVQLIEPLKETNNDISHAYEAKNKKIKSEVKN